MVFNQIPCDIKRQIFKFNRLEALKKREKTNHMLKLIDSMYYIKNLNSVGVDSSHLPRDIKGREKHINTINRFSRDQYEKKNDVINQLKLRNMTILVAQRMSDEDKETYMRCQGWDDIAVAIKPLALVLNCTKKTNKGWIPYDEDKYNYIKKFYVSDEEFPKYWIASPNNQIEKGFTHYWSRLVGNYATANHIHDINYDSPTLNAWLQGVIDQGDALLPIVHDGQPIELPNIREGDSDSDSDSDDDDY